MTHAHRKQMSSSEVAMRRKSIVPFLVLMTLLPVGCESDLAGTLPEPIVTRPIVNGETEEGFPAVGALVIVVPDWGYFGSYCTGTLIDPYWVLTAGHCVTAQQGGWPLIPGIVRFYVGNDARARGGSGGPSTGRMVQVEDFFPFPDYDPEGLVGFDDVGLVLLAEPITDVTPMPLNLRALGGADLDTPIRYVGFGVSNGRTQSGGGLKRTTTLPLTWLTDETYLADMDGSGTCFGDSGGPGLLEEGDEWRVAGVVSAGTSMSGGGADPCATGTGIYMRVDAYASWIAEVTGLTFDSCAGTDQCLCPQACRADGTCDNLACRTRTCSEGMGCLAGCAAGDNGCAMDCQFLVTQTAFVPLRNAWYCIDAACPTGTPDRLECVAAACADKLAKCVADATSTGDCASLATCLDLCAAGDDLCIDACNRVASVEAMAARSQMADCLESECGVAANLAGRTSECARTACRAQIETCLPPPPCDLTGGTCPEGQACRPDGDGTTCVASGGGGAGDACDPGQAAPCADGLTCDGEGDTGTCRPVCVGDDACADGDRCVANAGPAGLGLCRCIDEDGDGACLLQDCDDGDADRYPGRDEVCGNGVDDNCDGEVDEGCEAPEANGDTGGAPGGGSDGCAASAGGTASATGAWLLLIAACGVMGGRRRHARLPGAPGVR